MGDKIEMGQNTPTRMCVRCKTHAPAHIPTVNDDTREMQYCPFCGRRMAGDETIEEMQRYIEDDSPRSNVEDLADLVRQTTAARGLDLFAVDIEGESATDWAEMTGRDRSTVSRNVRRARSQISD